ncbi:MAG: lipoyl synthase [Candidatus Neomarinimicrobiota bacterium]|nr:MAG: lipoyl synthase [Candidatus Neomarinimicrobiota bacterium]
MVDLKRKPEWLKVKFTVGENFRDIRNIVHKHNLHTVCEEAHCPNQSECWERRAATFMILGDTCTRNCRFCAVNSGNPNPIDKDEPKNVGRAVKLMGLKYCVITSVTRDDLYDGGAEIWAETISEIKRQNPDCKVEVLIPDFKGNNDALETVLNAKPDVLGHNLETIKDLYPAARPQANYEQSLWVLKESKKRGAITKTGIMVGLGETKEQVLELMQDAIDAGCDIFTAGQYLQPTKNHLLIDRYVHPNEFEFYKTEGLRMGFRAVMSGPLVRSSYHADEQVNLLGF